MGIPVEQQLAYQNGAEAYRAGSPLMHNPYPPTHKTFASWRSGWLRAEKDLGAAALTGEDS
jgi:hypothetical protein